MTGLGNIPERDWKATLFSHMGLPIAQNYTSLGIQPIPSTASRIAKETFTTEVLLTRPVL